MKKIISSYVENLDNELMIELFITDRCNFKCYYCTSKFDNENHGNININDAIKFIDCISKSRYDSTVSIVGGEPTLHKDLNQILLCCYKNVKKVELYTNGSTDLRKVRCDLCKTIISIHPYIFFRFKKQILNNLNYLKSNKYQYQIKLMVENLDLTEIINEISKISEFYPYFIVDESHRKFIIPENSEFIDRKFICFGNGMISIKTYIKKYQLTKKPMYCLNNALAIYQTGNVYNYCNSYRSNLNKDKYAIKKYEIALKKCYLCRLKGCAELEIPRFIV